MMNPANFLTRACLFACASILIISCKDTDDFLNEKEDTPIVNGANTFDFSTSQTVDLRVDYSDFKANIPVFFSVYNTNPFVNENTLGEYIDENIKPIFSAYTNKQGKFDETVTLPAYAKRLHIVTGNFLVGLRRDMAAVENGEATMSVKKPVADASARSITRASGTSSLRRCAAFSIFSTSL